MDRSSLWTRQHGFQNYFNLFPSYASPQKVSIFGIINSSIVASQKTKIFGRKCKHKHIGSAYRKMNIFKMSSPKTFVTIAHKVFSLHFHACLLCFKFGECMAKTIPLSKLQDKHCPHHMVNEYGRTTSDSSLYTGSPSSPSTSARW